VAVAAWPQAAILARSIQAREARLRRLGALLLDLVFFSILVAIVDGVYGVTQVTGGTPPNGQPGSFYISTVTTVAWPSLCLVAVAYSFVPEAFFGATPGKLLTGLRVVRVDGRPLGLGAVLTRNVLRLVDMLPLQYLLGGVLVLLSSSSQRLGDMAAGTTVVARTDALDVGATRTAGRMALGALVAGLMIAIVFTIAFDYYGRPPLVLQGLYNEHQLLGVDVTAYELGTAQWSADRVTYPITFYSGQKQCSGTVELNWAGTDWQMGEASWVCKS
jgi:uncharacterized RDD family membrane protein YckC